MRQAREGLVAIIFLAGLATACRDEQPVLLLHDAAKEAVVVEVDTANSLGPISPLIYGFHIPDGPALDPLDYETLRPSLLRFPGFRATTYNWEINASNGGRSWCNENGSFFSDRSQPAAALLDVANLARRLGAALVVAVPIGDHVAGDRIGGSGPPECTGDVFKDANYLQTRFVRNAPAPIMPAASLPNLNDGAVYASELAAWLRQQLADGPQVIFSLDRMPDTWSTFHPALWPLPVTYDQVCQRGVAFAEALKTAWPGALVTGPVVTGWAGLTALGPATERPNKGDFFAHYARCMRAAQPAPALLDALDFHWSSGAVVGQEVVGSTSTSAAVVQARVQAPRSLWDPAFSDTSPAAETEGPLRLLPRLREALDAIAPGIDIFVSEWSFGGSDHPSGGVAVADALGIFGTHGVRMAALRWHQERQRFNIAALRMYRNFDGEGGQFGAMAVATRSQDIERVSAYASVNEAGQTLVMLINKATAPTSVRLVVAGSRGNWSRFQLDGESPQPRRTADVQASNAELRLDLPALSVVLLRSP